jgi:hypothetical protein
MMMIYISNKQPVSPTYFRMPAHLYYIANTFSILHHCQTFLRLEKKMLLNYVIPTFNVTSVCVL